MWIKPAMSQPGHLCDTFRDVAASAFHALSIGRGVGVAPWETSLTDMTLLQIASNHPDQVRIIRFDASRETVTGADWEWWFRDTSGFAGFRVQAKRRKGTGSVDLRQKTSDGLELQLKRFQRVSLRSQLFPFYCLYGDVTPTSPTPAGPGPCPHGPVDPRQWGVSLLSATAAQDLVTTHKRISGPMVFEQSCPWYQLVCPGTGAGVVTNIRKFIHEYQRRYDLDPDTRSLTGEQPPDDIRGYFERATPDADRVARLSGLVLFDLADPWPRTYMADIDS